MFSDITKVKPKEAAQIMAAELQRKNDFFLSQHRVDLYKKKLKKIDLYRGLYRGINAIGCR